MIFNLQAPSTNTEITADSWEQGIRKAERLAYILRTDVYLTYDGHTEQIQEPARWEIR